MLDEHPYLIYDTIPYGEVTDLFPLSSLSQKAIVRDGAALEAIDATPAEDIVAVAPVSMATGYKLAQEPLQAVRLDRLPAREAVPDKLADYELLVRGRPTQHSNHTLSEYA
jgi:hypothetical protein